MAEVLVSRKANRNDMANNEGALSTAQSVEKTPEARAILDDLMRVSHTANRDHLVDCRRVVHEVESRTCADLDDPS